MKKPNILAIALTVSLAIATVASGVTVAPGLVTWQAQDQATVLRIGGPDGSVQELAFGPGETPSIGLFDKAGDVLQDGLYSWELIAQAAPPKSPSAKNGALRGLETSAATKTLSGSFTVSNGDFVIPSVSEGAAKDQQILDDLIVDGSACVGQDCVNGENFGFDTLRLKENNLRMHFDDTSNSASFPSNDWRLVANDSSNGGGNYFAIEDSTAGRQSFRVEAGARANALYVESDGDIGIGTNNPVVDVHVVTGNTPTVRLDQDGSSGFTPQAWDLAGNETNFFIRDSTNGSRLPFRIKPSAPTDSIFIAANGDVGIGTPSPGNQLHVVRANTNVALQLDVTGSNPQSWTMRTNSTTRNLEIRNDTGTATLPFRIGPAPNSNLLLVGLTDATTPTADRVTVNGVLNVNGTIEVNGGVVHSDYVFESDFDLKSIDDHAAFMWQNKHLPALPKAPEGLKGPVNLVAHQMGILEELETAHIYIEQLSNAVKELQKQIEELKSEKAAE